MINPHFFKIFKSSRIIHCFSTREGGFSRIPFNSLNLGLTTADDTDIVTQNRNSFFDFMNIDNSKLAIPQQTHSANVEIVSKPGIYKDTDALISATPGLVLTIQTADCFPVFIYDPLIHLCAIIHSGWRGTAQNIVEKTIAKAVDKFGCLPHNMLVAIGPGIQQKNYQVDLNTAKNFANDFLKKDGKNHFKLNIQKNIVAQLVKAGIRKEYIETDTRCTFDNKDLFYSYRRDGIKSGRMMGIIGLL